MTLLPLARDQAAIVTLYTGTIAGPVEDAVALAARLLERPVLVHELGSGPVADELAGLVRPAFEAIGANAAMPEPVWPDPP